MTLKSLNIRLATPTDAATIEAQRHAMYLDMGTDEAKLAPLHAASLTWLERMLTAGLYTGFLAELNGETVGGAGLLWQDMPPNPDSRVTTRAYIMNVYVRPQSRGQGVARQLLGRVLAECAARGVTVISLHASEAGRPLYAELGFSATNEMKLVQFATRD